MKTWFITGISRGLGQALAAAALARGDVVIGTAREGAPSLDAAPGRLHVLELDMTDVSAIEATAARAFGLAPRIDVLVNNAGYGLLGAFEDVADAEMTRLFAVNVFGPFRLIRAALPHFRAQGGGHIVNITSIAGRAPNSGSALYAASKFALEGLSEALALEAAPLGVKVTAVAPGAFRTDFLSAHSLRRAPARSEAYADTAGATTQRLDAMAGRQIGDPERAAAAILAVVDAENPPRHLLLGSDALRRARENLDALTADMKIWEPVTKGTDFPAGG